MQIVYIKIVSSLNIRFRLVSGRFIPEARVKLNKNRILARQKQREVSFLAAIIGLTLHLQQNFILPCFYAPVFTGICFEILTVGFECVPVAC